MAKPVNEAVRILRAGGLVAFPTETVYGLGADATRADAVRKIFAAKGRPSTNPLIVHVADRDIARRYATVWPEPAELLARAFWPGALTIILPKHPSIVDEATAGRNTVALRVPDHPLTLELLRAFDGPLAGPSANRSMRVSPTSAEHVRQELGDAVDLILDGGPCRVGIESTVVDLTRPQAAILRPGGVGNEQIERVIGPVEWRHATISPSVVSDSPGRHEIHYAPQTPAFWFDAGDAENLRKFLQKRDPQTVVVVSISRAAESWPIERIAMPPEAAAYARQLYASLRQADDSGVKTILIEMPPDESAWQAIRDRLLRASRPLAQRVE